MDRSLKKKKRAFPFFQSDGVGILRLVFFSSSTIGYYNVLLFKYVFKK